MKYNINEEERKTLELIWEKTLQNFPEGTETDMEKSLADYIENCGLPETDEHGALAGEDLDKYLEETGLTFEDIRTIIEE